MHLSLKVHSLQAEAGDHKFEPSLSYIVRPISKYKKLKGKKKIFFF
jgi:hypothetical protein